MSADRWFLVKRRNGKFHGVIAYDSEKRALDAYADAEGLPALNPFFCKDYEVVLLIADRLATLIATHGNWFDEPTGLDELVEDALSRGER